MDNLILTLAVRWLHASDAISASQVCKNWRETLDRNQDNGTLWKQCCLNTNPLATAQFPTHNKTDYRRLACGFIRQVMASPIIQEKTSLRPSLECPNDVICIIDLYRRTNDTSIPDIVASWVSPLANNDKTSMAKENFVNETILQGRNPYFLPSLVESTQSYGISPLRFAIRDLYMSSGLCIKVTLFCKDSLRSVCLVDGPFQASVCIETGTTRKVLLNTSTTFQLTSSRLQRQHDDGNYLSTSVQVELVPLLPAPHSSEESIWLEECRNATGSTCLWHPSSEALKALEDVPFFEFQVEQVSLKLNSSDNDLTSSLNGLAWK